jgi:hypothetical protein
MLSASRPVSADIRDLSADVRDGRSRSSYLKSGADYAPGTTGYSEHEVQTIPPSSTHDVT